MVRFKSTDINASINVIRHITQRNVIWKPTVLWCRLFLQLIQYSYIDLHFFLMLVSINEIVPDLFHNWQPLHLRTRVVSAVLLCLDQA